MTSDNEAVLGVSEASKDKIDVSSYQDPLTVSEDCNRTKLDAVNVIGSNETVHPDDSSVSDSDYCVVTTYGPNCDNESGEAIVVLDSKVLDLQYEKVVGDIVQSSVIDEISSESMSTHKGMLGMKNGTDVEEHEHGQLMAEDNREVGVNNRGILEPVEECRSLSLSTEKDVLLQGKVNDLTNDDGLEQPNGTIVDGEEHYKVEVEDPKACEVTSKHPYSDNSYNTELDSGHKIVVEVEVVSNGSMAKSTLLNENQRVSLSDLCIGDVNNCTNTVHQPNGKDSEEQNDLQLESKIEVEDQADLVSTPTQNKNKDSDIDAIEESPQPAMPLESENSDYDVPINEIVSAPVPDIVSGKHSEKVVEGNVQSSVIDETSSESMSTQKGMLGMQNGSDVEEHEHGQLMVEDNREVGVNNREILEPVDECQSLSLSTKKEVLLQSKVNDLTNDDGLEQPNGTILDCEENYKVEVKDPKACEVTSKHPNSDNKYNTELDSGNKIVVEEEVVSNGNMVELTLLNENQRVSLSNLCIGEVNNCTNTVHQPNGTDSEEQNDLQLESKVEVGDQADLVSTPDQNQNKDSDIDAIEAGLQPAMPLESQNSDYGVPINEIVSAPVPDIVSGTEKYSEGLLSQADDAGDFPLTITKRTINPENAECLTEDNIGELLAESDENLQAGSHDSTLVRKDDCVLSPITKHVESESVLHSAASSPTSESKVDNGINIMPSGTVLSLTGIEFGSFRPSEMMVSVFPSQVPNEVTEHAHKPTISNLKNDHPVQIETCYHVNLESVLQTSSENISSNIPNKDATIHGSDVVRGKCGDVVTLQVVGDDKPESNTLQMSTTGIIASLPQASADVIDTLKLGDKGGSKSFRYIVKVPSFDDEKLREQLRTAQLLLDEKTHQRESINIEVQKKRSNCQVLANNIRNAKSEEIAARKLVKLKWQEIDSVQVVINRLKNAISVGDINCRISGLEHKIEHETLPLKEEKLLIREIKQQKLLRDQLSSNMGSHDEVKQAFDQRDHIDGHLKILKMELDGLKDKVLKAEGATSLLRTKYDDENEKLKELHAQYKKTNDIRQEAYKHFSAMKGELKDKKKYFWMYKDDIKAANDYALCGDKEALHSLCVNQVETMMELWNNNDDFRKEYVRCNMRSTVRRFKTLDGRSLGPDEEALVLPNYVDLRVNRQLSSPGMPTSPSVVSTLEQKKPLPPVKEEVVGDSKSIKVAEQKNYKRKSETVAQPIPGSGSETVSSEVETRETNSDENLQIEEQLEMATKTGTLREKERDEELKERRRLEEKAKALEALERKKRTAEKAQIRADVRAQKEAEQKQKEREKRLRKKERRKSAMVVDAQKIDTNGESSTALELPDDIANEFVDKENSTTAVKRPKETSTYLTKQSKTKVIPPPLRNKSKRNWKQPILWIFLIVIIFFVIFGGEGGAFKNSSSRR